MPVHLCWSWGCPEHSYPFKGGREGKEPPSPAWGVAFQTPWSSGPPPAPLPALLSLFLEPHLADSGPAGSRHSSRLRFWEQPWPVG